MRFWMVAALATTALAAHAAAQEAGDEPKPPQGGPGRSGYVGLTWVPRRVFDPAGIPDCANLHQYRPPARFVDFVQAPWPPGKLVAEATIGDLGRRLAAGEMTAECLAAEYALRIDVMDPDPEPPFHGPNAVIAANPHVFADARASDARRKGGKAPGPLEGIPILLKDNIESWDGTATTAGSLALADNRPKRDAPLVRRLTDAGALILGKTNLSEWANFRSSRSLSGWSAVGGQTRNPYAFDRSPCGSSSGSAVAVAAGFAAGAIGTETDGSITCPAAVNGIVGLKPTVGLISRTGVVPISHTQDTPGPMTRTVADAAALLTVLAGSDPADPATAEADARKADYARALDPRALQGARIGVLRSATGANAETDAVFEAALAVLRAQGAVLVDIARIERHGDMGAAETVVLNTEFKADLNAYLAGTDPAQVKTRTLADLIAFNRTHADREMPVFGQEVFEAAEATKGLDDPAYLAARANARRWAGPQGVDQLLADNMVVAIIAPTLAPAWMIDPVLRDRYVGAGGLGGLAAVAGYPHLTVPMGQVRGLPVGLSFVGPAWSEARLLGLGYAYEQASHARRPPTFAATVR